MIARIRDVPQEKALAYAVLGVLLTIVMFGLSVAIGGLGWTPMHLATGVVAIANLAWLALTWNNKWGHEGRDA